MSARKKPRPPANAEKPVSLNPLGFEEAMAALLAVKPERSEKTKKPGKRSKQLAHR
jgi:hypothetical protein